jgi:hypothetical protein
MDDFLVDRLESLMMHSPVSPYSMARSVICGAWVDWGFLMFCKPLHPLILDVFAFSVATLIEFIRYCETFKLERINAKGFINPHRGQYMCRVLMLVSTFFWLLVGLALRDFWGILAALVLAVDTSGYYLASLNWTPPPPKPVRAPAFALGSA